MKVTDLHDPFEGYAGLSRFPLTFASLPVPNSDDLHCIHNFLMSLPVQSPDKLIRQAKAILDNTTQVPDFGMISDATSEEKNEVIGDIAAQHPKGQRPGIDRERASFHLLPSLSQPTVNLEPTAVNCNMNPVEYFLAFDRRQKAIKEIAKHRGGTFTGSDQYNVFKVPQAERPGLQGRSKKPKYEHMYSEIPSQKTCEGDILSSCGLRQETAQSDVASQQTEPDNVESQQLESTNVALQHIKSAIVATEELEMTGSTAKGKKTASQIFDDLLADGYGDLEGERAENLLLEHLQIKSPHKKLNLPDMQDLLKIDFEVPRVNLPKSRNVSSNILLEISRNRTPAKLKNMETSIPNFGSPTPPKSPLALLSLSEKHIFQSNPSRDTFSAIGIDQSPARSVSPVENIIKCSDPIGSKKALCIPGKLKSTTKEDDVPVDGRSSIEVAIEGSTSSFEKDVNGSLTSLGSGSEMDNRESGPELEGNNVGIGNESINENLSQADANADHRKDGLGNLEDIVEDAMQDAEAFAEPNRNTDYSPMETSQSNQNGLDPAIVEDQPMDESTDNVNSASFQTQETSLELTQATSSTLQTEKMKEISVRSTNELEKGKSRPHEERRKSIWQRHTDAAILEDQPVHESAENVNSASFQTQDTSLEQTQATISTLQTEKMKKISMQSTNKLRKGKSGSRKVRESSRRQSLAGCGMSWEAGVRRSTRIRSRPLEFWRGERFLYARIHQGLPSVIGIKYESPENATFKVKSFVSEKHKHLFDQAAL